MKIAVYGAAGYTGKLIVTELARRDIEVILIGRDTDRLRTAAIQTGLEDAQTRRAEVDDHAGLVRAFTGCDAVINCAGPFILSGESVVRASIAAKCHYVDIAGEQLYIKRIFDTFAAEAQAAGVTVVPAANDDGLPSDLIAHLAAERVRPIRELVVGLELVRSGAMPSRGTLRSGLVNMETFTSGGLGYEDGLWDRDIPARRTSMTFPGSSEPVSVVKFPLPAVVLVPHHVQAQRIEGVTPIELVAAFAGITPALVESVPEGPAEENRRDARWIIAVEATGEDDRLSRGIVEGTDTQGSTAVIAVEAARRLVVDGATPGVLAPAQAYAAEDFLDFLVPHGVHWSIRPTSTPPAS